MGLFSSYPYQNFSDYNLDWIINTVKTYTALVDDLNDWKAEHVKEYAELKAFMDAINAGKFPDGFANALKTWIDNNVTSIIQTAIKNVWFGLTDAGYFVAYIPDGWDDIIFNTSGYDYTIAGYDYGHLILSY